MVHMPNLAYSLFLYDSKGKNVCYTFFIKEEYTIVTIAHRIQNIYPCYEGIKMNITVTFSSEITKARKQREIHH